MTIEAGVVIDNDLLPIYWHLPKERTGGSLPDSQQLWNVLWEKRDEIYAVAHSHPGYGLPSPSYTDVTTFAAVEAALGKRLFWPIITGDSLAVFSWHGPEKYDYKMDLAVMANSKIWMPEWVRELREKSNFVIQEDLNKENDNGRQYYPGQ